MLLEEVILHLLRTSGYSPIERADSDTTLHQGPSGLEVRGRGATHQIDAIADYVVQQPFSNPQRLLIEAKCFDEGKNVDLEMVRNALGTLRDVSEFWARDNRRRGSRRPPKPRFHYIYAIFSATGYTKPAQDYAYAQDIYLFQVARSRHFAPILESIRAAANNLLSDERSLSEIRSHVRDRLARLQVEAFRRDDRNDLITPIVNACAQIQGAYITRFDGRFPVFLIPFRDADLPLESSHPIPVRIRWDEAGWYIVRANERESRLFSFDLPAELFRHYAEGKRLSVRAALNLKEHVMSEFQAVRRVGDTLELFQFRLDQNWIRRIRQHLDKGD